jgi:hypothetical protein
MRFSLGLPVMLTAGLAIGLASVSAAEPKTIVLTVGPAGQYKTVSAAAAAANHDGDVNTYYDIRVAPGTYINDFPMVSRPMTIETATPGRTVVLKATVPLPNGKGIIAMVSSLKVNGLTFTGAEIANALGGNAAGIRDQNTGPASLIVENSIFTGNQEGILTGFDANETIAVSNSKFINNGNPSHGYFQHGLYVNYAGRAIVRNNLFCGQLIGHDVKSRAAVTVVENNRIYDAAADPALGCNAGSSSYAIDAPNGGVVTISGNRIIQGATTENERMVAYGEEGLRYAANKFLVSSNSFSSSGVPGAIAIYDPRCIPVQLSDNTFSGIPTIVSPPNCAVDPGKK